MSALLPANKALSWWNELFPATGAGAGPLTCEFHALKKSGRTFLLLPTQSRLAAEGLQLYPAQKALARLSRGALSCWLRCGLPAPGKKILLAIAGEDALLDFLRQLPTCADGAQTPRPRVDDETRGRGVRAPFAVLAGNPFTAGRRFILLVWKPDGTTAGVVKIGRGSEAMKLIEREENFLRDVPAQFSGVPRVVDSLMTESLRAFAMPFVSGKNPPLEMPRCVEELLSSWVTPEQTISLGEIKSWRTLRATISGDSSFHQLAGTLESRRIGTTLMHGDFAPWNLRVNANGQCAAMDWERGEFPGVPGWDWFHYVIQPAILVRNLRGEKLRKRTEALLDSSAFQGYAHKADIAGAERVLMLSYLRHVVHILKPAEGLEENRALLAALEIAWLSRAK